MLEFIARSWRRHELRRQTESATVTLLVGDVSASLRSVTALRALEQLAVFETHSEDALQLATQWLRRAETSCDLQASAFGVIAEALPESLSELRASWVARSNAERWAWLERQLERQQLRQVRAALLWLELSLPPPKAAEAPSDPLHELALLSGWLPRALWPVPCLSPASAGGLGALAELAARMPALALIAIIDEPSWKRLGRELDAGRLALLAEGVVGGDDAAPSSLQSPTVAADESLLRAYADAREAGEQARDAALVQVHRRALEECARAAALRLLFELLQAEPVTRDHFTLHARMPFAFGSEHPVPPELDLASLGLRVALEVDGYHHASAGQRDRRRDITLQAHGFVIARYFATDIVEQSSQVMQSIVQLVCHRQPRLGMSNR